MRKYKAGDKVRYSVLWQFEELLQANGGLQQGDESEILMVTSKGYIIRSKYDSVYFKQQQDSLKSLRPFTYVDDDQIEPLTDDPLEQEFIEVEVEDERELREYLKDSIAAILRGEGIGND